MWFLAHGSGIDDIAMMVGVIVLGLLLLRRSERSVRTRAQEADTEANTGPNTAADTATDTVGDTAADTGPANAESAGVDSSENDSNSV